MNPRGQQPAIVLRTWVHSGLVLYAPSTVNPPGLFEWANPVLGRQQAFLTGMPSNLLESTLGGAAPPSVDSSRLLGIPVRNACCRPRTGFAHSNRPGGLTVDGAYRTRPLWTHVRRTIAGCCPRGFIY